MVGQFLNLVKTGVFKISMNQFTGFIFGDVDKPEFRFLRGSVFDFMHKIFVGNENIFCCGEPDVVVIAQSYPNQFSQDFLYNILSYWSIVPVILLSGVGCVGELRTGKPLAGCFRLYVHEWNEFWYDQLKRYAKNNKSVFDLPRTYCDDEIFLDAAKNYSSYILPNPINTKVAPKHQKRNNQPPNTTPKNIPTPVWAVGFAPEQPLRDATLACSASGILKQLEYNNAANNICLIVSGEGVLGNDYTMNKLLADYATSRGYSCVFNCQNLPIQPKLVLIDTDDSGIEYIVESVQRLRRFFADSEFNVYINSPRFSEVEALFGVGVDDVISKPFFWMP
ncbi:MAG: hypothetical protein LBJ00_02190 [Planctomycetaceae bacterium]|nr:hypothetical protein [Planctomycetaceae bacterium]